MIDMCIRQLMHAAHGGEPTSSLQHWSAWSQARPATSIFRPPPVLSSMEEPALHHAPGKQVPQKQDVQHRKPHVGTIQRTSVLPNQSAWASKSMVPAQSKQQCVPPADAEGRLGRQVAHGQGSLALDEAEPGQIPNQILPDNDLNDYPEIRQQLAVPRGRGRGSKSPVRNGIRSADPSPDPSPSSLPGGEGKNA